MATNLKLLHLPLKNVKKTKQYSQTIQAREQNSKFLYTYHVFKCKISPNSIQNHSKNILVRF